MSWNDLCPGRKTFTFSLTSCRRQEKLTPEAGRLGWITLALVLILTGLVSAQPPSFRPGRILVQPRVGLSDGALSGILKQNRGRSLKRISPLNIHLVEVEKGREVAVSRLLARNPAIQFAELDQLLEPGEVLGNDPYFSSAWHLTKIGAPTAWESSLGNSVIVAVLDTGVNSSHPDLVGQLVPGWNIYDNNSNTEDVYGHGTKVAGTIAAASDNALGVTSIAWDAFVMPVRISRPDGNAYISTIAEGLIWAADHGARVANISYAASGSPAIQDAANHMRSLGGLVTVSAGNGGIDEGLGPIPSLLSISATNSSDTRPSWSSYGQFVDLSAPGVGIWTTREAGDFVKASGTSFSSPVVAAVIALMMAANPTLRPSELEGILLNTAQDIGSVGYDIYYGYGRVDAARAVLAALGAPPPDDTLPPSVSIVSPNGGTVSGTVLVDVGSSDNIGVTSVDFYADGTLVGTDLSSPYRFSWDTTALGDGPVALEAMARDEVGNQGVSDPVTVQVDNTPDTPDTTAPRVAITSPAAGSTVNKTVNIVVQAADDRTLALVKLFIDGSLVHSAAGSFSYSWNTRQAASGSHTLKATARDSAGNSSSTSIQVSKGANTRKGKGKP